MRDIKLASSAFALHMLSAMAALAQQPQQGVPADQAIPALMFFTLISGLVIGIGALIYFMRRRSNRAALERVLKD